MNHHVRRAALATPARSAGSAERRLLQRVYEILATPGVWVGHAPRFLHEQCLQTAINAARYELHLGPGVVHECVGSIMGAIHKLFPQEHGVFGIPPFNDSHSHLDVLSVVVEAISIASNAALVETFWPHKILPHDHIVAVLAPDDTDIDQQIWTMPGFIVAKPRSYYNPSGAMALAY